MKGLEQRRKICNRLGDRYYPPETRRDRRLLEAIRERLPHDGVFIDAGSGPELRLAEAIADRARVSVGIDLETFASAAPPAGARAVVGDLARLPLATGSVDVIATRSVLEHLVEPAAVFRECARALRPGGWLVALAPSRWYYASLIGRLMPSRLSRPTLEFVFGRTAYDNYPTYYRANTPRAVGRAADAAGMRLLESRQCPHPPDYLKFSPALFMLGVLFDRLTSAVRPLRPLGPSYLFLLRKP